MRDPLSCLRSVCLSPALRSAFAALCVSTVVLTAQGQGVFPAVRDRDEALSSLEKPDPLSRAAAIQYFARTGLPADAPLLIPRLRDENAAIRELAERGVWMVWSHSGDPEVDRLLAEGIAQMQAGELRTAIGTFSRVIRKTPEFAEGWNKRATAYFLAGELQKSLADCDEVMKRNPQHFGALSGYGQIYLQLEEFEKALAYFRRALEVNPNLGGVEISIRRLEALLAERRRRTI